MQSGNDRLLLLTHKIAKSYIETNTVELDEVSHMINLISISLQKIIPHKPSEPPTPFVDPKKSIHDQYIICLEDGRKMPMIKRHIRETYGLSPDQYRERWGLPKNYPMVAPGYAKKRAQIAKDMGLGKRKR